MKEKIFKIYSELSDIMTVNGFCKKNAEKILNVVKKYTGDFFSDSECEISPHGSIILNSGTEMRENGVFAVDAHIDTIGAVVTEILPDGFLSVTNCGGIDARILPSKEVKIHCRDNSEIYGIFTSVPPHLNPKKEAPQLSSLYVDTGLDEKKLSELVYVGSPVSFDIRRKRLAGDMICGPHLDDKLCAAAAICAFSELNKNDLKNGVSLILSAGEECDGSGAAFAAEKNFSSALVLDVNFASGKGIEEYVSAPSGKGISISYCAGTSVKLTSRLEALLKENSLPYSKIIETLDTGTNASRLNCMGRGTPCAVASIPISYMHTPVETASLYDAQILSLAVKAAVSDGMISARRIIK